MAGMIGPFTGCGSTLVILTHANRTKNSGRWVNKTSGMVKRRVNYSSSKPRYPRTNQAQSTSSQTDHPLPRPKSPS